jgi:hypothetical protein
MGARAKKKDSGTRNDTRPNGKAWSIKKHGPRPPETVISQARIDHDRTVQEKLKAKGTNAIKDAS